MVGVSVAGLPVGVRVGTPVAGLTVAGLPVGTTVFCEVLMCVCGSGGMGLG